MQVVKMISSVLHQKCFEFCHRPDFKPRPIARDMALILKGSRAIDKADCASLLFRLGFVQLRSFVLVK